MKFFVEDFGSPDYKMYHMFYTNPAHKRTLSNMYGVGVCFQNAEKTHWLIETKYSPDWGNDGPTQVFSRKWKKHFESPLVGLRIILKEARRNEKKWISNVGH